MPEKFIGDQANHLDELHRFCSPILARNGTISAAAAGIMVDGLVISPPLCEKKIVINICSVLSRDRP